MTTYFGTVDGTGWTFLFCHPSITVNTDKQSITTRTGVVQKRNMPMMDDIKCTVNEYIMQDVLSFAVDGSPHARHTKYESIPHF